jgi:hypothetical protein
MAALVSAAHVGFWPGKTPPPPAYSFPFVVSRPSPSLPRESSASASSAALACSTAGWLRGSVRQRPAAGRLHGCAQGPRRWRPGHLATQSPEPRRRRAETGAGDGASGGWLEPPPLPPMLMCTMCLFLCAR